MSITTYFSPHYNTAQTRRIKKRKKKNFFNLIINTLSEDQNLVDSEKKVKY